MATSNAFSVTSANSFDYCENNPVNYSDRLGFCISDLFDIYFAADSIVTLIYDPSLENLLFAIVDTVAILPVIPSSGYARCGMGIIDSLVDSTKVSRKALKLSHADRYGILPYRELRKLTKGTGLEAHHIIEKRLANRLGLDCNTMLSVAVTKEEHNLFTKAWREQIPYGTIYEELTDAQIWNAAKKVYRDYPELMSIAKRTIYPRGVR